MKLKLLLLIGSCYILYGCSDSTKPEKIPNIVFLLADDQRYSTIHAWGNNDIITPTLDNLSSEGMSFRNTYIMGGTSGAVCAPSRAMIMTGRSLYHLNKEGEYYYPIKPETITLPEFLLENGYNTIGIGKQHNGKEVYARGFTQGGHLLFGGMSSHYKIPTYDFDVKGVYLEKDKYYALGKHSSEIYTTDAIQFINSYDQKKPFFLYVAYQAPHDPREMPEEFLKIYQDKKINLPPNFASQHEFNNGELVIRDELLAGFPRTEESVISHLKAYYAMITHLDHQIGLILKTLDDNGMKENTLVIFAADNGLAVGQHGLMGKQNIYEHSVKVPLIISGPGIPTGKSTNAFIFLNDIFPTIADYLDQEIPSSVEGISFEELFDNPGSSHREVIPLGYKNYQRGIRKDKWKLLEYHINGERNTQLFNLEDDPYETHNLVDFPAQESKVIELRKELIEQKNLLNDTSKFWIGIEFKY